MKHCIDEFCLDPCQIAAGQGYFTITGATRQSISRIYDRFWMGFNMCGLVFFVSVCSEIPKN